jgi:hypothetical protein
MEEVGGHEGGGFDGEDMKRLIDSVAMIISVIVGLLLLALLIGGVWYEVHIHTSEEVRNFMIAEFLIVVAGWALFRTFNNKP